MFELIQTHLAGKDNILERVMEEVSLPKINRTGDVFHDLMSCVIEQQIHYRSTKKVFQKLLDRSGIEILNPDNFHIFEREALKDLKLSKVKYEAINNVLEYFQKEHHRWSEMHAIDVREKLSKIGGVGKWSIDMILLYTLNKPNVFPEEDYHLKKVMEELYQLDSKNNLTCQMRKIAEQWTPYRSFGVKYLLAWKDLKL